jgi:hypothetical protein
LRKTGGPLTESRKGKRFTVDWPVRVEGTNGGGDNFKQAGVLQNISSGGAMLCLANPVAEGTKLDVFIMLPFKGKKWMRYSAHVVRIEEGGSEFAAAVMFEGARPDFAIT